jgi:uncharacterized protein (TIGR03437 family)
MGGSGRYVPYSNLPTDLRLILFASLLCAHLPAAALPRPALNFEKNFGGTGSDAATAIAVDRAGNIYVAGTTTSLDFPTVNAFQPHIGGTPLRMSADQGNTWLAPSAPAPIYAVAGSPKQPNIVFAGTAKGILKSLDSGKTWTLLSAAPTYQVNALVVDSANPDLVYAATTFGTYQSQDGGMTWRVIDQHQGVDALVSAPARSSTLFSAIEVNGPSVYRTTDSGYTWSLLANSPLGAFSLACDPVNPDVLYAAAARYGIFGRGNGAIYKTIDAGEIWIKIADLPISVSTFTLAANTAAVYVGTDNGVLFSRDGGATWTQTSVTAATDNIAVDATNPRIVYAASARGIFRSTDGGTTWSISLAVRQNVQTLAIVPTNPPAVFVGATPGQNIFVTKWSGDGKQMLYSTYLGGGFYDFATGIAVDNQGNAYVTGYTFSQDFPVSPGALQSKNSGASNAFLAKVGPQGDKLLYATYLGGSTGDAASAIALDSAGNAYLTGYAGSSDFPVTASAQQTKLLEKCTTPPAPRWPSRVNLGDAFVSKINADGSQLAYSTFLGGTCGEQGLGIAVDSAGNAVVVGVTDSLDFPVTSSALQPKYTGASFSGFLAKLTPQGSLSFATYLGGAGNDTAEAVALDAQGGVYVTGSTSGFDATQFGFPEPTLLGIPLSANQFTIGFPFETSGAAYLLKLNSSAWTRSYLHYVGGNLGEATAIAVDSIGRAWITGMTGFPFPTVHPFQAKAGAGFVSELSTDGSTLLFSSDADTDSGNALALDASGNAFVTGSTLFGIFTFNGSNGSVLSAERPLLIRIDADVPSSVTVEEPQRLIPKMGTYPFDGIAPGELLVITGTGLGPDQEVPTQLTPDGNIATSLGGTTVTFDGVPAPLLSVQSGRIVCIAPFALGQNSSLPVMQVQSNNALANAIRLGTVETAIGVIAIVNPDGNSNSPDQPAASDSLVTIYVTGLGQTIPPSMDGEISVTGSRVFQVGPIHVNINGTDAELIYLGATPGQVSAITRIDVRVPPLPPGQYTLKVGWGSPLQDFSAFPFNVGYP